MIMQIYEKSLLDRVKDYASSVMVRDTPWLDLLMNDIIMELTEIERLRDGNRPLPFDRDEYGRMVRKAWVRWAQTQPYQKPTWLVPYDKLPEPDKEADRQIGEAIARWTLIGDAARAARKP